MADPLFHLVNAPRSTRRAVALGLLSAACTLVALLGFAALSSTWRLEQELRDKRELAGRLKAITVLKPALLAQVQAEPARAEDFLEGGSVAMARGALQAQASTLASAQGANLLSTSNGPEISIDGVRYLGIDIDLSGTVETVHNTVFALEMARPLIVRSASFWLSGAPQGPDTTQPPELTAQLQVFGALQPEITGSAGKAGP